MVADWTEDYKREDVLRGLEYPYGFRRRRGAGAAGGGTIVLTPSVLTVPDNATPGTVIGTVSVTGGTGTYIFTLNDPLGHFTIVGNQIQVSSIPTAGLYTVIINGNNGAGDTPSLQTTILVTTSAYVPTYFIYGF